MWAMTKQHPILLRAAQYQQMRLSKLGSSLLRLCFSVPKLSTKEWVVPLGLYHEWKKANFTATTFASEPFDHQPPGFSMGFWLKLRTKTGGTCPKTSVQTREHKAAWSPAVDFSTNPHGQCFGTRMRFKLSQQGCQKAFQKNTSN